MPELYEPPTVIALHGAERVIILEKLGELLQSVGAMDDGAFDHAEFDGRSLSPAAVLDACATAPFLAARRTVVVRRAQSIDKANSAVLAKSLPSLPSSALLILVFEHDEETKDFAKDPLVLAAGKAGKAIACESPQGAALVRQLMDRAKVAGGEMTKPAAEALSQLVSGSLTLATAELDKLLLYAGGQKIDEQMVHKVAAPSQTWKVFELLDAVVQGRLGVALENLKYLLEGTSSPQEAAMRFLLPQLHRQVRLLWQAKVCQVEGLAPEKAGHLLPKGKNLANSHSFVRDKLSRSARDLSLDQIAAMLRCVLEADMRMKGQLPFATPKETLERLLAEMCEIAAGRIAAASL
ncbi:MAG: DNA polymerase III subunit delta [Armatimonadota bacterium]|nr:DNA polymerase III subunit delta [Armatimonadota bacterium]